MPWKRLKATLVVGIVITLLSTAFAFGTPIEKVGKQLSGDALFTYIPPVDSSWRDSFEIPDRDSSWRDSLEFPPLDSSWRDSIEFPPRDSSWRDSIPGGHRDSFSLPPFDSLHLPPRDSFRIPPIPPMDSLDLPPLDSLDIPRRDTCPWRDSLPGHHRDSFEFPHRDSMELPPHDSCDRDSFHVPPRDSFDWPRRDTCDRDSTRWPPHDSTRHDSTHWPPHDSTRYDSTDWPCDTCDHGGGSWDTLGKAAHSGIQNDGVTNVENTSLSLAPNPFVNKVSFSYTIHQKGRVQLRVYNTNGEMLEKVVDRPQQSGSYTVQWHPRNLPAGKYLGVLESKSSKRRVTILHLE